ncbi:MAG: hypothetical protein JXO72_09800 [Vicinamibacteria bacterium]|nr:hypothetical protein [Vicinamibacteria bacterium]
MKRRGEKIGWIGGWAGSFLWLALFSIVQLARGRVSDGVIGAALFVLALLLIVTLTPWRFPQTPYWKLLLSPYVLFMASVAFVLWSVEEAAKTSMTPFALLVFLPMLSPFVTIGRRRWRDGEPPESSQKNRT